MAVTPCSIIDIRQSSQFQRQQAAEILVAALMHVPSAWKDQQSASEEVSSFITDTDRLGMLAVSEGDVVGWIGAIRHSEFAWELHPLVVKPELHRRGIGTELVRALEAAAQRESVITIWLGTDDDFGGTNLFSRDLYPDVLSALRELRATTGHPFTFYQKLGYYVTGVFPDADGLGKHDILMAKRLGNQFPGSP